MPHFSWWRILLAGALASVLGACARGPEAMLQPVNPMVVRDRPGADLSRYTTIQVIVEPYQDGAVPHGFEVTSEALRREFSDNLRASGKFAVAETETQGGKTLEARLSIDALNYVHGAARGTTGILAGRAVLNATLTLRDKETGAVIDVIRGSHASSHVHGVFGATTGRQVTAIAKEFSSRLVVGKGNAPATASPTVAAPVAPVPTSRAEPTDSGVEIMFWESIRASNEPGDFSAYLEQYPQGRFVALARNRLAALGHTPAPPAPAKPASTSSAAPAQIATSASASRLPSQGDTWTYRLTEPKRTDGPKQRNYTVKVSAASLSGIVEQYSIDQGPTGEWTHKGERHVVALGKSLFAPYLLAFGDLPQGSLGRLQVVDPACGAVYVCEASGRILTRETIRVPAGTFDTVRVEVQQNWRPVAISGPQGAQNHGGRALTVWYALAAKRAVKFRSRPTFGQLGAIDADFDLELESYRLQ